MDGTRTLAVADVLGTSLSAKMIVSRLKRRNFRDSPPSPI